MVARTLTSANGHCVGLESDASKAVDDDGNGFTNVLLCPAPDP